MIEIAIFPRSKMTITIKAPPVEKRGTYRNSRNQIVSVA